MRSRGPTAMRMDLRPCPICKLTDRSALVAESTVDYDRLGDFAFASRKVPEYMHHRLLRCDRCDLLYCSPIPNAGRLAQEYEAAAFDSGPEARCAANTYGKSLSWIQKTLPDLDGALDIGTGDGAFLQTLLAAGFTDVVGVEPSTAPIAAADPTIRPLIQHRVFQPGSFAAGRFSIVCCFQTLEHVTDPLAICAEAWRILKPDGAIFLIVHNRRAFSAKILGHKSPIFDVEHLQLFSKASMTHLLGEAGFIQTRVERLINRYPLRYWVRLFPLPPVGKAGVIRFLDAVKLGRFPLAIPAGNIVAVGFKPSDAKPGDAIP
jgi:SAM-dependent methyltransferase